MIPQELKYTKDHEWVKEEDGKVRVGITHHAQKELGDIVFVELPEVGKVAKKGELLGTVESVKAVGEVYAPVSGEVVEANSALESTPELVNKDPYGEGWIFVLKLADPAELEELLDAAGYESLVGGQG
ncbi:glycine cleavage system protein GcvH [Candidatus Bipolaricaulota bacterium]|nr:glycine cleavage system protein GcvH [Candidatus Bipolaricaulota bacterium]